MALLNVDNLSVSFVTRNGTNKAVDNVCRARLGELMGGQRASKDRIYWRYPRTSYAPFAGATSR